MCTDFNLLYRILHCEAVSVLCSRSCVNILFSLFKGSVTDKPPGPPNSGRKGELGFMEMCVCVRERFSRYTEIHSLEIIKPQTLLQLYFCQIKWVLAECQLVA